MSWTRRDWLTLLLLTLLATCLRFYKLGEVPPGFQFDEAFNAIDAEQVWHGNRPLFLPANGGREALYTYLQAAIGAWLGFDIYSLRLASALAGILAIPAAYWLLRTMLQRQSRAVALYTALALAVSFWHLHFSHYGIRVILMPLLMSGLIGSYWLALHAPVRRTRWLALVAAGLLTGLAPWTHPAGRFVPFILIGYSGWLLWRQRAAKAVRALPAPRQILATLLLVGGIALFIFLPLGLEFYRHPDFFFGHASEVSVFAERVSGEQSPWRMLSENLLRVLGMFNVRGDADWAHNLPGRPVFEWPLGVAFLAGVLLWGNRLVRQRQADPDVDALALLAGWTVVMVMPSVLSEAAPNYSRALPALPALFVATGLGLAGLVRVAQQWRYPWLGHAVAAAVVVVCGIWASYDYFVRFPAMPESYYVYDVDKLDALATLQARASAGNTVYLGPLWSEHATFAFLRDPTIIKSLDSGNTLVLPPPGQGAVYAFPDEKLAQAEDVAREWEGVDVEIFNDRFGKPLLALVQVPANRLLAWPARYEPEPAAAMHELPARFDDAPTLLGLQQRNDNRELRLFWRAEAPTLRNLTTFLHFLDQDGRRVAQVDKLPGNGTYLTPTWTLGERIIEEYPVELSEICANGNPLALVVGWYELAADGARRPRLDGAGNPAGDSAHAGTVTLPIQAYPPADLPLPPALDESIATDLILHGYQVHGDHVVPGGSLSIDLFWWASDALNDLPVALQLHLPKEPVLLWQGIIAPAVPWHAGELICRRLHVTLPAAVAPGSHTLALQTPNTPAITFHTLHIGEP